MTVDLAQPGIPGLIALPSVAIVGHLFGWLYVSRLGGLHPLGKVAIHAIMLCVVSATFWVWAAYKLLAQGDPDYGVVSFLLAFVAAYRTADLCAVQISRAASRPKGPAPLLRMQTLLPLACFVPMLNYLAVLILVPTLPFTFQIYLCVGAGLWSLAALRGGWLLGEDTVVTSLRDEVRAQRRKAAAEERQGLCSANGEGSA